MASDSSYSPWLYKAAAVGATVTLAAGAGYVLYKYVLSPEPEVDEKEPIPLQSLLTGGAAGASKPTTRPAAKPTFPVRKTPSPSRARAGPSLPARKGPAPTSPKSPAGEPCSDAATPEGPSSDAAGPSTSTDTSAAAAPGAAPPAAKPVAANLKACACCAKPLSSGLPLRCAQCKTTYYCSTACQKKHWSEHKLTCAKAAPEKPDASAAAEGEAKPASDDAPAAAAAAPEAAADAAGGSAASAAGAVSTPSTNADEKAEAPAEEATKPEAEAGSAEAAEAAAGGEEAAEASTSADPRASGSGASGGGGLQGALVEVLRQAAAKGAGTLDGAFEEAVMHFLGGKLQVALKAFEALQTSARAQSRSDLVAELHKWLGHTNTKLGNFTAAADAFQAGMDEAKKAGNTMAQVDNAVGLGNLWKMAGQLTKAAEVLKGALIVAQEADSAGMQSEVLVALGNVIMSADAEEGLECLQIAVKLREDEVAKAAETGDRAAMATGMMQAAAAMVNMGAALFATHRFQQSKQAYEQAMEIFELMEDYDKVIQVLINLANLAELQLDEPQQALEYREKLAAILKAAGHPGLAGGSASTSCGVCKKPISLYKSRPRSDPKAAMLLLGCLHVQHDSCFKEWSDEKQIPAAALAAGLAAAEGGAGGGEAAAALAATAASLGAKRTTVCPTCKAPVPVMS